MKFYKELIRTLNDIFIWWLFPFQTWLTCFSSFCNSDALPNGQEFCWIPLSRALYKSGGGFTIEQGDLNRREQHWSVFDNVWILWSSLKMLISDEIGKTWNPTIDLSSSSFWLWHNFWKTKCLHHCYFNCSHYYCHNHQAIFLVNCSRALLMAKNIASADWRSAIIGRSDCQMISNTWLILIFHPFKWFYQWCNQLFISLIFYWSYLVLWMNSFDEIFQWHLARRYLQLPLPFINLPSFLCP